MFQTRYKTIRKLYSDHFGVALRNILQICQNFQKTLQSRLSKFVKLFDQILNLERLFFAIFARFQSWRPQHSGSSTAAPENYHDEPMFFCLCHDEPKQFCNDEPNVFAMTSHRWIDP